MPRLSAEMSLWSSLCEHVKYHGVYTGPFVWTMPDITLNNRTLIAEQFSATIEYQQIVMLKGAKKALVDYYNQKVKSVTGTSVKPERQ